MRNAQNCVLVAIASAAFLAGCGSGGGSAEPIVVNSLLDDAAPPEGTVTLRSALAAAASGQPLTFDASLDGGTIELSLVAETHTVLKGEVMGMTTDPVTHVPISYLVGYYERDYGASALYARKDVAIDARSLPRGITIRCSAATAARVLAVYGDLTMERVTVTGGRSLAEPIPETEWAQTATLARGAGVAVWGTARLTACTLFDNLCDKSADTGSARDRGAFGAGIYADAVALEDCVVAGNVVQGSGASGAGVFTVGGAEAPGSVSSLVSCAVTGNRITAGTGYGGGVYSDGGGIGNAKTLSLVNCTAARNVIEPSVPVSSWGYWRGGAIYMSNGYLRLQGCTIVENEVSGLWRVDNLGKPSLAGGVAATIGDAHAVESMVVAQCIVAGNTVTRVDAAKVPVATWAEDVFTGSLLHFRSMGHNRIGVVNFDQILAPVGEPDWQSLCRKHYPQAGDLEGEALADLVVLPPAASDLSPWILSAGVDAGEPVPLRYRPLGTALDQVPADTTIWELYAEYEVAPGHEDDFLECILARVEDGYGLPGFAAAFTLDFEAFIQTVDADAVAAGRQPYTSPGGAPIESLAGTAFFGPAQEWPRRFYNYPWIHFWHRLDAALKTEGVAALGQELLGEDAWDLLFSEGLVPGTHVLMYLDWVSAGSMPRLSEDQTDTPRPLNALGDIGAVEVP
jgi:hypothetical protein